MELSQKLPYFEPADQALLEDFLPSSGRPFLETHPDQGKLQEPDFDQEHISAEDNFSNDKLLDRNDSQLRPPNSPLPHLTLTYAMSLDSKISLGPGASTALSSSLTGSMAHYIRSRHDAILVGVGTANADDPSLNCRYSADGKSVVGFDKQPIPIILDPSGRWNCRRECKVLQLARSGKGKPVFWMVNKARIRNIDTVRRDNFEGAGFIVPLDEPDATCVLDWGFLLRRLSSCGIASVMVEGGGRVIEDLLREHNQKFVSSVIITIAPVWLGKGGVDVSPARKNGAGHREVGRLDTVRWLPLSNSPDGVIAGRFKEQSQCVE
jgi:2,5-diamino-6-(ribosylamino)-4(3H)-pyrimidinone 5'-phosphate reductase